MSISTDLAPAAPAPKRNTLAALNAGAIVVAALYFGRELLVPIVLSVLLAFVLAPLVVLLQRLRIPRGPAVLSVVALAFIVLAGIGIEVGREVSNLAQSMPAYQDTIQAKVKSLTVGGEELTRLFNGARSILGGDTPSTSPAISASPSDAAPTPPAARTRTGAAQPAAPAPAAKPAAAAPIDAVSALTILQTVAAPIFGPLATAGVVAVFVIFVLMAREDLRDRLVRLLGRQDLHRSILALNDTASRLSRYFLFQLLLNACFGLFIGCGLWAFGMPSPALWGIIAGTMRFVPFIGTAIAVIPPVLLALIVSPGWSLALTVLALFLVTDLLTSQIIEPLLYGHSTGLSPIAIIVSAAFWAFLWGPVGLLLATPLTVCLVVLGRYVEALAFLEVMLGDMPPLEPAETFYQRALEGNVRELALQARKSIAATSLADYYDKVALQGLALAQNDLARDALAFERLEAINAHLGTLLAALGTTAPRPAAPDPTLPPNWRRTGAVLCIPGRGQLDALAATMSVQVMNDAGFGAAELPNAALGDAADPAPDSSHVALCCLSVLEGGSTPSGIRYLIRRIARQMPNATVVICLWHAEASSPLLQTLRAEGEEETIVLSLSELVALARALAARAPASTQASTPGTPTAILTAPAIAADLPGPAMNPQTG